MKTLGEMEAAFCVGISRFEQDYMGRGPKSIHTHLLGDLLVVRLQGVLTAAEQQLVESLPSEKGRDLLKQVRTHLVETARPVLEAMVQEITGVKVLSLHHDISTVTGEEVVVFTLAESPVFRETRKHSAARGESDFLPGPDSRASGFHWRRRWSCAHRPPAQDLRCVRRHERTISAILRRIVDGGVSSGRAPCYTPGGRFAEPGRSRRL